MTLLAIDTSTEKATVALFSKGEYLTAETLNLKQHAVWVLPTIDRLLIEMGVSLTQLDGVVFGRGPGRFTGLRVACSIAKGLAYAVDLPLYPVSSLSAITARVHLKQTELASDTGVLAVIDARMHEVYWSYFPPGSTQSLEYVSLFSAITVPPAVPFILAGVDFEPYLLGLPIELQKRMVHQWSVYPRAEDMIRLVQQGHILAIEATHAMPSYIRNQVT